MYCLGFCFSIFFISLNFLTTPQCLVLLCSSSVIFAYVSTLTNEYLLITDNTPKKWRNWYFCVQPVFFHINIFLVFVCPESVIFFIFSFLSLYFALSMRLIFYLDLLLNSLMVLLLYILLCLLYILKWIFKIICQLLSLLCNTDVL